MGIGHSEGQLGVVVEFGVVEVITKDGGLRRADSESLLDGLQGSPLGSGPRHHVDPVRARDYGLHIGNGGRQRPVALELGIAAQRLAATGRYDAIIALGAVIKGATAHFDIVIGESAKALSHVALSHDIPVINGVLTTNNIEQAVERAGTKAGNKGAEAALVAIEMVSLLRQIG